MVFSLILGITYLLPQAIEKYERVWRIRNWLLATASVLFVFSIIVMSMFGYRQTFYVARSETVFLTGNPDYRWISFNVSLSMADQVSVKIQSVENQDFSYVFLDSNNYELYSNPETRADAKLSKSDFFGSDFSFTAVAESSSDYCLVMKSDYFLGNNVTYSIQVLRIDNLVQVWALFGSVACISILLATSISMTSHGRALVFSPTSRIRRRQSW
jgi:hypothetical protein